VHRLDHPEQKHLRPAKAAGSGHLRRIAKGIRKFVIDAANPFIVPIANWSGESVQSAHDPLRTVTSWPRGGSFAMASPIIAPAMCGNSVSPPPMAALARANDPWRVSERQAEAA